MFLELGSSLGLAVFLAERKEDLRKILVLGRNQTKIAAGRSVANHDNKDDHFVCR